MRRFDQQFAARAGQATAGFEQGPVQRTRRHAEHRVEDFLAGKRMRARDFEHGIVAQLPDETAMRTNHAASGTKRVVKDRSGEHTSEIQSLMRLSYAVFYLKKKHITHNEYFTK